MTPDGIAQIRLRLFETILSSQRERRKALSEGASGSSPSWYRYEMETLLGAINWERAQQGNDAVELCALLAHERAVTQKVAELPADKAGGAYAELLATVAVEFVSSWLSMADIRAAIRSMLRADYFPMSEVLSANGAALRRQRILNLMAVVNDERARRGRAPLAFDTFEAYEGVSQNGGDYLDRVSSHAIDLINRI